MFPLVLSEDLGLYRKTEAYFQVSENTVPVFKANRKVPFAAIETLDEELDRLKKSGVVKKAD